MRMMLGLLVAATLLGCAVESTNDDLAFSAQTNLFWQRCAVGTRWDGTTCVGEPVALGWDASVDACDALGPGFRLPSLSEVAMLLGGCTEGAAPASCMPCLASDECASVLADDRFGWTWTADPVEGGALVVDLHEGRIAFDDVARGFNVRCVFSDPEGSPPD